VLDEKPTDPDANLTVGKFYCLVKGDWQLGVSMLALADNTPYGAPARKELEGVSSPEEQVALGDAWWELAQQGNDSDNTAFLLHATMWYRRAIPRLAPGLLKAKVEQRLTQVDDTPGRDRVAEIPRGALLVMTFERKTFGASQGKTFVRDLSGNDNHGVVEGAVLAKEGKAGSALLFNGRNAHVLLPRMRFLMTRGLTELSISVWVHNREAKNSAVFDVGHWADSDVRIDSLSSRGYRFGLPDMHGGVDLDAAVDGIGTWRHVVGVWDGKEQRIYVDGELKGQVAVPGAALNERTISDIPARIGGQAKSPDRAPRYFNGMIDELAVFNRAITPEEIRALYERGKSGQTLK